MNWQRVLYVQTLFKIMPYKQYYFLRVYKHLIKFLYEGIGNTKS